MVIASKNRETLKGFTLLELLLVLVIAIAIIIFGINRYRVYTQEKNIAVIKHNINAIMQTLNTNYRKTCQADQPYQPNISELKLKLEKSSLVNLKNYQVAAKLIQRTRISKKPIYQLTTTAVINLPNTQTQVLDNYLRSLNAQSRNGNVFTWTRLPSYTVKTMSHNLWVMDAGLRDFKEHATGRSAADKSCAY